MDVFLGEWANLLIRWAHMIVGIGWIGTSFYFMALDYGLNTKERKSEGVYGTAWQVHGGGFYHVEKFTVAPPKLPDASALVQVGRVSHLRDRLGPADRAVLPARQSYLIDPAVMPLEPWQAVAISVVSLLAGWVIYERCAARLSASNAVCSARAYSR